MTDDVKKHADKIVADTLDGYLTGGARRKPEPIAPYVRGSRWSSDELEWESAKPTTRQTWRRMDEEEDEMPLFPKKREALPVAKAVRIDEPDRETLKECRDMVRVGNKQAEMSSFLLIKMADLVMREMENAMECGGLIWKSEMACFDAKLLVERLIKEKVLFQTKHGELLPVVVR